LFSEVVSLKCWVGFHSVSISDFQLKECNESSSTVIAGVDKPWGAPPGTEEFVCAKVPEAGTQYKDCMARGDVPVWYRTLRRGCNGSVCYCDDTDGCNKGARGKEGGGGRMMGLLALGVFCFGRSPC
jgi:hypothetical protein